MARRIIFTQGEFYHIYNRGTEKRTTFLSHSDYVHFVNLLYLANGEHAIEFKGSHPSSREVFETDRGKPLVRISAYCLMPNHFHLLLQEFEEKGISRFMQKLGTGYTMYFNEKYERSGVLFQGKFKAEHVDSDRYLKYLVSYIHLNPIKLIDAAWKEKGIRNETGAQKYLEQFRYSSFKDYAGQSRIEGGLLDMDVLPEYWSGAGDFKKMTTEWLRYINK